MTDHRVTRVLVANRGEIARRVVATCHRLGLSAVAVCSDPDLDAPHVREADAAVRLPGSTATDTYLRGDKLVDAALRARADAVPSGVRLPVGERRLRASRGGRGPHLDRPFP